jgi:CBS domain-containing protein
MPSVADVIKSKSSKKVLTTKAGASVLDAARAMNDHRVGSLVVVDDYLTDTIVGIITERDMLTRVLAPQKSPSRTTVAEVMTDRVLTCTGETDIEEVRLVMQAKRVRHLPVVDGLGRLIGMISIGDLNQATVRVLAETVQYLERYSVRM